MKKLIIVSGTSKGIGNAFMQYILSLNIDLITINRHSIKIQHPNLIGDLVYDLSNLEGMDKLRQQILPLIKKEEFQKILLINNAAITGPIKPMDSVHLEDIKKTIDTNLTSPLILSSLILKSTKALGIKMDMVHISSGAAFHPIHGLGAYCISKAGLEMMSKSFSIENDAEKFTSISIGPGVVDTSMQKNIRNTNKENFAEIDRFKSFKEKGLLEDTSFVAKKIIDFLLKNKFISGTHYDLNNL